jgi:tetratricopeptide (TPR) repeat protein
VVHQVHRAELIPGGIADTTARLLLWGKRSSGSLARVEFSSDFSRQKVVSELRYQFKEKQIPFYEIKLPIREKPSIVFNFLFKELENIASGVVSISGFETAFNRNIPLFDALRVINFNRENLAQFTLRQIWWMSRPFNSEAIRVMPDLNSWFSLRLFLTEDTFDIVCFSGHGDNITGDKIGGDKINVLPNHNLPSRGSREFIGRERELQRIHDALNEDNQSTVIALSGMGGVGKTELALQYAWRELDDETYSGGICWLNALNNDPGIQIINFASQYLKLMLPDQGTLTERVRYCWQHWTEGGVLIIFDDVRDYEDIKPYLPPRQDKRFKVLITTRFNYLSNAIHTINLNLLTEAEGLKLLELYLGSKRIGAELEQAKNLCQELGYLPLALELVAHFLIQQEGCTIEEFRHRLTERRLEDESLNHIDSNMTAERGVKASLELGWQQLNDEVQKLALYLSLFALAPFSLSLIEELLSDENKDDVKERLTNSLVRFSFVQVLDENQYQLHTLIHRYLRDKLDQSEIAGTAKSRYCKVISNISSQIPNTPVLRDIANFTPLIPHLEQAATEFQNHIADDDILELYGGLSRYYEGQGLYALAEPWLTDCFKLTQINFGENHPHVATSLNNLANLYQSQGRYEEAEPLYLQALELYKRLLGENHSYVASSLNNLAELYRSQGKYEEAKPLYLQALELYKRILGENHPSVASSLNNLAELYRSQGKYEEAKPLYLQALELRKRLLGKNHPSVATSLNNLANSYYSQGRYEEAEPLYLQALELRKQLLGENHPDVATPLNNLASLYYSQGRYEEAEPLYLQALELRKQLLGENHPDVANSRNNLAVLYLFQGKYEEAELLYLKALAIAEQALGENHPTTVQIRENLQMMRQQQHPSS